MIARHWNGIAKPGKANDYIHHLQQDTFPQLRALPGFIRASILQRDLADGTEFLIITEWQSIEDIHAFAGADPEKAVVPSVVRDMMISFDERVRHYTVTFTS